MTESNRLTSGVEQSPRICTQPSCMLRDPDAAVQLRDFVLRGLSGAQPVAPLASANRKIELRSVCSDCAARVMRGLAPLPTAAQYQRNCRVGDWSRRRARRRARIVG